jgi:branched-chain amino acid transport system substrate-binding protein
MRRPRASTLALAAVTAATAAVTAACGVSSVSNTPGLAAGPTGTPITIGISEPLSGPAQAQGFAPDGQACLKGYELWASDVNSHGGLLGRPVKLIVMNDRGWPASTAYDYNWLIKHDHVDLVLAPFSSLLTALGAEKATHNLGYALVAGSAGAPSVFQNGDPDLFSTTIPVQTELVPFTTWVTRTLLHQPGHPTSAAYPMVSDPFADPPVAYARGILSSHGIRSVLYPGANGYTKVSNAALTADAKQVVRLNPGIVVLGSVAVPTVQLFMKVFAAQGWTPKYFIATSGPDQGQAFLNAVGTGNAVGMMVPNGWYGGYPDALSHVMVQNYIARYGGTASTVNGDVAESYSAGQVLAAAVTATGGTNQAKIIAYLHKSTTTVQTVVGKVAFASNGANTLAGQTASVFQWQTPSGGGAPQFVEVLRGNGSVQTRPVVKAALSK